MTHRTIYFFVAVALIVLFVSVALGFSSKPTMNKAALGRLLFFDPILSADRSISCASCHKPDFAFADTSGVSRGVGGARGNRNTPTTMNVRLQRIFFWDGRASTLEEQALAPIENPAEMNLPVGDALLRLRSDPRYHNYFEEVFNQEPSAQNLAQALAAFERTLETSDSPFDQWKFYGKPQAVSTSAQRGFELFNKKGKCVQCHFGADFTSSDMRNIGLFNGSDMNDSGRMNITHKAEDLGRFKVPSLRNVLVTAPYMHNGRFRTLAEVIDFYNNPKAKVPNAQNLDTLLQKPLGLTQEEQRDLVAFLVSLTDQQFATKQKRIRATNSER